MFTRLRLTNFKAWTDTGDVELKPVTMLLGTNSSGKSTLIQSLLLLKQTVQSPDRTVHLNLGGDEVSDLFNFGGFDDVLNKSVEGARQFSIGFDFEGKGNNRVNGGQFDCTYGQTSSGSVAIQTLDLRTSDRRFRAIRRDKGAFSIVVDEETQPRFKGRNYAPERSIAFSADAIADLDQDGAVVEDLSLAIRRMQTLTAKQQMSTGHSAMYFVERKGKVANLRGLELDEFGRLKNWPKGFFGDALGETREQARLMFERQQAAKT